MFLWIKSLHIIFIISWFAGLFYLARLYIYWIEAGHREEAAKAILRDQLEIMSKRLWLYITTPAMVLSSVFGITLLLLVPGYLNEPWMHLKLLGVFMLLIYHFHLGSLLKKIQSQTLNWKSTTMRAYNEIPTVLLLLCVFAIVLKNLQSTLVGLLTGLLLGAALFTLVKRVRKKKGMPN